MTAVSVECPFLKPDWKELSFNADTINRVDLFLFSEKNQMTVQSISINNQTVEIAQELLITDSIKIKVKIYFQIILITVYKTTSNHCF